MLRSIESTEDELSTWRDASLLGRLNAHPVGEPFAAPSWLCGLLEELRHWHDETNGAFDPAIGSIVEIWDLRGNGRIPTSEERESARLRAGIRLFAVSSPPCVVTRRSDATLDSGAFGKGLALDRLRAVDFGSGGRWLVDLGGQVAVGPASKGGRQVALAHPIERDRPVVEVRIEHGSLAVSGGSERDRVVDGVRVGHILDPRTGRPVSRAFSVAVWHPRALVADILATALYVMGADEGLAWAEERGLAVCFLLPVASEKTPTGPLGVELSATVAFTRRFL
jgi:thiamine biosynthesis lipoprotein